MSKLLNSFPHSCFHTPRCNVHQHPDLHRCDRGAAHVELVASTAAHVKKHSDPNVDCPACNDVAKAMSKGAINCTVSIHPDMAKQAGLMDDKGAVTCPQCGGPTTLVAGEKKAEIHAQLCTDETIHYPEMRKAGKITEDQFQAWKATLTREELLGHYKRVPDIHVMAKFTHDETALMETDLPAFNALLTTRLHEAAENSLLHQAPYRHTTTTATVSL